MLFSSVENITNTNYCNENFQKAYTWLNTTDLAKLPLGRNEISGEDVFANVQSYQTVNYQDKEFEAHNEYYDIQFMLEGSEKIYLAHREDLEIMEENLEADFLMLKSPKQADALTLRKNELLIVGPNEAHKPGCINESCLDVKKIVIKVKVN